MITAYQVWTRSPKLFPVHLSSLLLNRNLSLNGDPNHAKATDSNTLMKGPGTHKMLLRLNECHSEDGRCARGWATFGDIEVTKLLLYPAEHENGVWSTPWMPSGKCCTEAWMKEVVNPRGPRTRIYFYCGSRLTLGGRFSSESDMWKFQTPELARLGLMSARVTRRAWGRHGRSSELCSVLWDSPCVCFSPPPAVEVWIWWLV